MCIVIKDILESDYRNGYGCRNIIKDSKPIHEPVEGKDIFYHLVLDIKVGEKFVGTECVEISYDKALTIYNRVYEEYHKDILEWIRKIPLQELTKGIYNTNVEVTE